MAQYPNVLKDAKVYNAANAVYLGLVSVTLPKVMWEKSEYKALGVTGSLNLPVVGNVQDMTTTFNFHTPTASAFALFNGSAAQLKVVSSFQLYDASKGTYAYVDEEVIMNVIFSSWDHGKREYSSKGDCSVEGTVTYLSVYFGGNKQQEIDPFSGVAIANGQDLNAASRAITG